MDGARLGDSVRGGVGVFTPLAAELGDLKRIRDASSSDSLAVRAFRRGWARLAAGEDARDVALSVTADALAAARLGGIDRAVLLGAGVADPDTILRRSFDEVASPLAPGLRDVLRGALGQTGTFGPAPAFAEALIRQPRAGATCPGKPRLVLEPPENHGDHCLVVAVLGTVLAGHYGADPTTAFLAGMAHHLHNAFLPDSGFAGEILLGDELGPLMRRLFDRELATLAPPVSATVRAALGTIGDANTPEGRAFNAADVMDRVLQMRQYDRVAAFTTSQALDDLELVHAGPLQAFHQAVLAEAGLP
jgi:5'-deoxynucleotidase YfbR-like HD superfamily hydrolase